MKRLQDLCCSTSAPDLAPFRRRGLARQRAQREREHGLRNRVVALTRSIFDLGWSRHEIAENLRLAPRTLRQWHVDIRQQRLRRQALGRPTCRSSVGQRNEVIALLDELGPRIGVPTLRDCFPDMARAELDDLLKRYRRLWRKQHQQALHVLHWQVPGTVWAMDYSEAPLPIDGLYPYFLAIRDLASGQQLLAQPVASPTADEALLALQSLLALHGAPLVLKTDNGSPFCAGATLDFLHQAKVIPLFSPPRTPRYNGAIEAGIGSLKSRTEYQAARQGHPGQWTWDNLQAAGLEANATARPHGLLGPTPDELWDSRSALSPDARALFHACLYRQRQQARLELNYPTEGPLPRKDDRALDRIAIRRALVEHGYLLFSRRRLPLTFNTKKAADIT